MVTEYIPEDYIPPAYDIRAKWEVVVPAILMAFALEIIFELMMLPGASDVVLVVFGLVTAFYMGRKLLYDFSVQREIKQMTEGV